MLRMILRWALFGVLAIMFVDGCGGPAPARPASAASSTPPPSQLRGLLQLLPAERLTPGTCPSGVRGYPAAIGNDNYEPNGDPLPSPLPSSQQPYIGCLQTGAGLTVTTATVIRDDADDQVNILLTRADARRLAALVDAAPTIPDVGDPMIAVVVDGQLVEGIGFLEDPDGHVPIQTDKVPQVTSTRIMQELTGSR
jgi:hypothetical protein